MLTLLGWLAAAWAAGASGEPVVTAAAPAWVIAGDTLWIEVRTGWPDGRAHLLRGSAVTAAVPTPALGGAGLRLRGPLLHLGAYPLRGGAARFGFAPRAPGEWALQVIAARGDVRSGSAAVVVRVLAAGGDDDGDGICNADEARAGSDPLSSAAAVPDGSKRPTGSTTPSGAARTGGGGAVGPVDSGDSAR